MDFAAHEAPQVAFKRPRGIEGEAGACEALLALFYAPVSRADASTAPRAPVRGSGSHKRPSEAAYTPASLRPQDPQEMAGSYHQFVYPYGHSTASNGAREEQARRQHVRQSAMRGSTGAGVGNGFWQQPHETVVAVIERPVGPADPHAASFEASCSTIATLRDEGKLDMEAVRVMRDAIDSFFAISREDFAGRHMLRLMRSLLKEEKQRAQPKSMTQLSPSQADEAVVKSSGFTWATEVLSTPNTFSCFLCFAGSRFEATCNDLMSLTFMDVGELCRRCVDMRSTYAHTLVSILAPWSVDPFMRAVFESCFSRQTIERQAIVQLKDRTGELIRCLSTIRCHWHEGTVALCIRFWPFSSLLAWPSFTEQAWS